MSVILGETRYAVVPGSRVQIPILIRNRSLSADAFWLRLEGIPYRWLEEPLEPFWLESGEQKLLKITLRPPRSPDSRAGQHRIGFEVLSRQAQDQAIRGELRLTMAAYSDFASDLQISPEAQGLRARIRIKNKGNLPETYRVVVPGRISRLSSASGQKIEVDAGATGAIEVRIPLARRPWIGGSVTRRVPFLVESSDRKSQTLQASYSQRSYFTPRGTAALASIAFAACVLLFIGIRSAVAGAVGDWPRALFSPAAVPTSRANYAPVGSQAQEIVFQSMETGDAGPGAAAQTIQDRVLLPTAFSPRTPTPIHSPTPSPPTVTPEPSQDRKVIYLTFDDGPSKTWTPRILELLRRYNARATFFVVGINVQEHPGITDRIWEEGHGLANHTWTHSSLRGQGWAGFSYQVAQTDALLGERAADCLRPPYGEVDYFTEQFAADMGKKVIMWDVDPFDWLRPGASYIANMVTSNAFPGAIVLLHDGGGDRSQTAAALETILAVLSERGYQFEAICR